MSKQERKAQESLERATASAAVAAASLREAFSLHREAEQLQRHIDALEAKAAEDRQERYDDEDAVIAAELEAEQATAAEQERRTRDEPVGSMEWAARQARDRGEITIPADIFALMPTKERERLYAEHRELWDSALEAHGTAALKAMTS